MLASELRQQARQWPPGLRALRIAAPDERQREEIYRLRHAVYATELRQHREVAEERLTDALDAHNEYISASLNGEVVGFVSITPPSLGQYSIDKYLTRAEIPFPVDDHLFEVRILTVRADMRGTPVAGILMYAALRLVEARGGTRIMGIGRTELLGLYRRVGLAVVGRHIRSGEVAFELMLASVATMRERANRYLPALRRVEPLIDWQLPMPMTPRVTAFHGGSSFVEIGERRAAGSTEAAVHADVLDAWFPPSPRVTDGIARDLAWTIRTSPPIHAEALARAIATRRGVPADGVVLGAGLSSLIFLAFQHWLRQSSRVLIVDPMYGEYQFVLEDLVGCRVQRLELDAADGFRMDLGALADTLRASLDLVVLVNPNNPTGDHVAARDLVSVIHKIPPETLVWIDETYVDYAALNDSVEAIVPYRPNVVVAKSMSKAYALSGLRLAYLCAPTGMAAELRRRTPPWAISLPAQIAGAEALRDPGYYAARYEETRALRMDLAAALEAIPGLAVFGSAANFLLCRLPSGWEGREVVLRCRDRGVLLRHFPDHPRLAQFVRIAVRDAAANATISDVLREVLDEGSPRSVSKIPLRIAG